MENNRQTHEKYGHEFPPFKKITIVNGLGPSQILFIGRDPIPSLIHSFFSSKLTIYNGQHVCLRWINVITNVKSMKGIFPPKYFTIFDGFMAIANTLFYIYDGRMFVTNNNTIKNIYFVFLTHKSRHKC